MFRWLSVFRGGAVLDSIQQVCGTSEVDNVAAFDGAESLARKSLLNVRHGSQQPARRASPPRLWMLETIREFAGELLATSGEVAQICARHAAHFLMLAEEFAREWHGPNQAQWLARMEDEHDNMRAALEWALTDEPGDRLGRVATALRLTGALSWFWAAQAHTEEGRRWLEKALQHDVNIAASMPRGPDQAAMKLARAEALRGAGLVTLELSDYETSRYYYERCLALSQELGDDYSIASALSGLSSVCLEVGDYAAARPLIEKSLQLWSQLGVTWRVVLAQNDLACSYRDRGNYTDAKQLFEANLALSMQHGDKYGMAVSLVNLGFTALRQSDYGQAGSYYQRGLDVWQELENKSFIASGLTQLRELYLEQGDFAAAASAIEQGIALCRKVGNTRLVAEGLNRSGLLRIALKDYTAARAAFAEALTLRRHLGDKWRIAQSLYGLALVAIEEEDYSVACSFLEQSLALRRKTGDTSGIATVMANQAVVALAQGRHAAARSLVERSLRIRRKLGHKSGIAACFTIMAGTGIQQLSSRQEVHYRPNGSQKKYTAKTVYRIRDDTPEVGKRAAIWLGAAEAMLEVIGGVLPLAEERIHTGAIHALQLLLGSSKFEAARRHGRSTPFSELIP